MGLSDQLTVYKPTDSDLMANEYSISRVGNIELTTRGVVVRGVTSPNELKAAAILAATFEDAGIWDVGDLALLGEELGKILPPSQDEESGEMVDAEHQCQQALGVLNEKTILNRMWVSQKIPRQERIYDLTWSHYRAVADLWETGEGQKILAKAERKRLSVREVTEMVKELNRRKKEGTAEALSSDDPKSPDEDPSIIIRKAKSKVLELIRLIDDIAGLTDLDTSRAEVDATELNELVLDLEEQWEQRIANMVDEIEEEDEQEESTVEYMDEQGSDAEEGTEAEATDESDNEVEEEVTDESQEGDEGVGAEVVSSEETSEPDAEYEDIEEDEF